MGIGSQAFPTWQTSQRVVSTWPKEAIERVLHAGLVSVFHGDCVLDSDQGCCILSGDTIIKVSSCTLYCVCVNNEICDFKSYCHFVIHQLSFSSTEYWTALNFLFWFQTLCNNFSVKRVVFLTDVQGIFDRPPHEAGTDTKISETLRAPTISFTELLCLGFRQEQSFCWETSTRVPA